MPPVSCRTPCSSPRSCKPVAAGDECRHACRRASLSARPQCGYARSGRRRRRRTRPCAAHPGERSRRGAVTTIVATGGGKLWLTNSVWRAAWVAAQFERRRVRLEEALRAARPHLDPRPHGPLAPPHSTHQQAALLGLGLVRAAQVELAEHLAAPLVAVLQRTCSSTQNRLPRARCSCCSSSTPPASPRPDPSITLGGPPRGGGRILRSARTLPASAALAARARRRRVWAAGLSELSRSLWLTAREARAEPGAARYSGFLGTGSPPRRVVDIVHLIRHLDEIKNRPQTIITSPNDHNSIPVPLLCRRRAYTSRTLNGGHMGGH